MLLLHGGLGWLLAKLLLDSLLAVLLPGDGECVEALDRWRTASGPDTQASA